MITSFRGKPWVILDSKPSDTKATTNRFELLSKLLEKGFPVKLASATKEIASTGDIERLVLCYDDATSNSCQSSSASSKVINIATMTMENIVGAVENFFAMLVEGTKTRNWKPWFPVIDYDRCTNCMQCLSFCLFDVYSVTPDKKITVQNQDNCKTDCPACSRVCPEVAIMFPKYKAGPINGDVVSADDIRREGMKVDISSLLGGDIYSMLRDRSVKAKSRFSAERDEDRALKERQRCLTKLKSLMGDLDIPADILSSLPSADQIKAKADAARQKAEQALAGDSTDPTLTHEQH